MSDNLRIRGQSQGRDFGGKPEGRSLERFKRGRRSGDLVRGFFLRLEGALPGAAWVNLEGEELLAQLPEDLAGLARRIFAGRGVGATPTGVSEADFPLRTGSPCLFILEALEPEPQLRMLGRREAEAAQASQAGALFETSALASAALASVAFVNESLLQVLAQAEQEAAQDWRKLSALPPVQLAARYAAARSALDKLLQKKLWPAARPLPERPLERLALYRNFVRDNSKALELYSGLALHRAALVRGLRPQGLRDLLFAPWLAPDCLELDVALLHDTFILQARLPQGWRLELRGRAGGVGFQKLLVPGEGDLLSFLLGLYPGGAGGGFFRRT